MPNTSTRTSKYKAMKLVKYEPGEGKNEFYFRINNGNIWFPPAVVSEAESWLRENYPGEMDDREWSSASFWTSEDLSGRKVMGIEPLPSQDIAGSVKLHKSSRIYRVAPDPGILECVGLQGKEGVKIPLEKKLLPARPGSEGPAKRLMFMQVRATAPRISPGAGPRASRAWHCSKGVVFEKPEHPFRECFVVYGAHGKPCSGDMVYVWPQSIVDPPGEGTGWATVTGADPDQDDIVYVETGGRSFRVFWKLTEKQTSPMDE